jgi:hypothetical protein
VFKNTQSGSSQSAVEINYNKKLNLVKFVFDEILTVGAGTLIIKYKGVLNGDMAGFYKSTYSDADGKKKIMASTQFEALDARRLAVQLMLCQSFIIVSSQSISMLGRACSEGHLLGDFDHPRPSDGPLQHARAVNDPLARQQEEGPLRHLPQDEHILASMGYWRV